MLNITQLLLLPGASTVSPGKFTNAELNVAAPSDLRE